MSLFYTRWNRYNVAIKLSINLIALSTFDRDNINGYCFVYFSLFLIENVIFIEKITQDRY